MSRGSTTSIQSAHEQHVAGNATDYPRQWFPTEQQQGYVDTDNNGAAGSMIGHTASQLHNPRDYGIDPALGAAVNHSMAYSQDMDYRPDTGRRSLPGESFAGSFMEEDSPVLEGRSDEQDDVDSIAGAVGPSKKASKSSAANELEMRQLFNNNKHRTLPDVATELHGNERGPQSERTRQVFAMLWYVTHFALHIHS